MFIRGTGIRASTVWHDRYASRLDPKQIATDRDIPLTAVHEALAYCQENWETIYREKDRERQYLDRLGFYEDMSPGTDEDISR